MTESPIMGVAEAAAFLGVTRQRASQLAIEHPQFPEPLGVLSTGPVWWAKDIKEFAKIPRPNGRPPKKRKEKEK